MRRRLLLPLVTGLVLAAGPLALAAPATAETLVVTDAKKDVRVLHEESIDKDPAIRDHDIVRTRINHRPQAVVVRVKHRSLTGAKAMQSTNLRIRTSAGQDYFADWYRIRGEGSFVELTDREGESVECKVTVANAPKKALRTLRVPRSCLGAPAWVRVQSGSMTVHKGKIRIDSGLGGGEHSFFRLSRRVRVG